MNNVAARVRRMLGEPEPARIFDEQRVGDDVVHRRALQLDVFDLVMKRVDQDLEFSRAHLLDEQGAALLDARVLSRQPARKCQCLVLAHGIDQSREPFGRGSQRDLAFPSRMKQVFVGARPLVFRHIAGVVTDHERIRPEASFGRIYLLVLWKRTEVRAIPMKSTAPAAFFFPSSSARIFLTGEKS